MPRRVILDTDTGVDDALAILLAMRSPELSVEAITGVCGNSPLDHCIRNIHITLDVLDVQSAPVVSRGEDRPLVRELAFAGDIHGIDGLGEVTRLVHADGARIYPEPTRRASPVHAVDLILKSTERYSDELTLIAVGPLTNVARAVMKDPDRMRGLREIIIMGGAFETHGNVSPVAEFNIHADPHAAQIVCDSGIPLVFVPLDVTRQALLDAELIYRYAEQGGARATFVRDCTARYVAFHRRKRGVNGCFLHDPLAVAVAIRDMGGAFETHGNVSPVAEFNIHADPHAAQIVCDSGIPLVFVPLDVTRQALLDAELINRYAQEGGARATFVRDCTARYVAFHRRKRGVNGCFLHDPLAVAVAIREDLVTLVPARVDVETSGDLTTGMTVADLRSQSGSEPNARVCTALDVREFLSLFEERVLA